MGDSCENVYKQYLLKRYWEPRNEYELPRVIPYEDAHIDLARNPYNNPKEPKTRVSEAALDKLINRVLTNQAIALADGKDYYEDFESNPLGYEADKIPGMYKVQSNSFAGGNLPKKRKNTRRSRSRKPTEEDDRYSDLPEGSEVSNVDGVPMVTLSIDMLRRYMYIEVEARVRYINDYYMKQWDEINKEKLASYAELIIVKDKCHKLYADLEEAEQLLLCYKNQCDLLGGKVELNKEAKRRRRQAKKQRKSDTPSASQSDTVSCAQAQDTREVAKAEESKVYKKRNRDENLEAEVSEASEEGKEDNIMSVSTENPNVGKADANLDKDLEGENTENKGNLQQVSGRTEEKEILEVSNGNLKVEEYDINMPERKGNEVEECEKVQTEPAGSLKDGKEMDDKTKKASERVSEHLEEENNAAGEKGEEMTN